MRVCRDPLPDGSPGGILGPVHLSSRTGDPGITLMCPPSLLRPLRHHSPVLSSLPRPPPRPPLPQSPAPFLADFSLLQTIFHLGLRVALLFHPWQLPTPVVGSLAFPSRPPFRIAPLPSLKTQKFSFPVPLLASCRE